MVSSHEKVYLFESKQIFKMNKQYDVLDTITIDREFDASIQSSYTNTDGMIFLIMNNGKVLCFDPFGEKQPTEIQDLQED